jgi:solute carrier family 25 (mitochondrial phosphate transporter), member 23/24/25/41
MSLGDKNKSKESEKPIIPKNEWKSNEKLSEELIQHIFNEIDENQKGWLSEKDLENHLNKFRLPNADMQAKLLYKTLTHQSRYTTGITLTEFRDYVKRREETLLEIYSEVDANQDGVITADELEKKLAHHSEIFADPAIAATASHTLISRISVGGNESCSFREFSRVFLLMVEVDVNIVFNHWAKYSHISGEDYSLPDEKSIEKSRINIFLSGAIAGCVSRTTTAPLDRLKVIMQAGKGDATIVNMCKYMYREGGITGFWRGNGINCVKIAPESAAKFLCYEEFKNIITSYTGGDSMTPSIGNK